MGHTLELALWLQFLNWKSMEMRGGGWSCLLIVFFKDLWSLIKIKIILILTRLH